MAKQKTLGEASEEYEPTVTKNIAELDSFNIDAPIEERTGTNSEGKEYSYMVAIIDGVEYRVPKTVLADIKTIREENPNAKVFKVKKKGEGLATEYTTIQKD